MRVKNDLTYRGIVVYILAVVLVIVASFFVITLLDWKTNFLGSGGGFGL